MNKEYLKAVKNYIDEINSIKEKGSSNEHSYRTPLENMLKFFAVNLCSNKSIKIVQESSIDDEDDKKIFPDFTIVNEDEQLIGFIECKDTDFDLNKAINGKGIYKKYKEQLIKYLYIHNNLIFTDYINFILLSKEDDENIIIKDEICIYDDAKKKKDKEEENYQKLINIFDMFFINKAKEIDKKDYFLYLLARRTKILRDFINIELLNKESYLSRDVKGLFESTLFKDLSDKDFADAFSQIITFSLLFYRLSRRKNADLNSFKDMPQYIPIFREFLLKIEIEEFNKHIIYSIDSIINAVNAYDEAIFYNELSYKERHDKEDPFIYMYEYFLKEFDEKTRNARGVFYTPIEAVRYIIKSIDELLKDKLNISGGLYSDNVHILDFAAGTGTFMLGAIELAYNNAKSSGIGGVWEKIVSDFILKRLYGFEFLIVPYVLAHFRIHEYLKDLNYDYKKKERLQLYLTNTLDNSAGGYAAMFPNMKAEADTAYKIKNEEPILVIMGNPPYNSKSEEINCKEWIIDLLKDYKKDLTGSEKQKLNDDYIKFLRFAHWKMEKTKQGIIGVIVNNSFINGVSHREMRNQLMKTFDEIYIFDLHGNMNKGEKCPDGSQDFNIFNIKDVGVCIALFIKTGIKNNKNKGIYFQEIFGKQNYKKEYLIDKSVNIDRENKKWKKLEDDEKWHWFTEVKSNEKYLNDFKGLHEIFENINSGIKTEKDELIIHLTENNLDNALNDIKTLDVENLCNKYNLKISKNKIECLYEAKNEILNNEGIKTLIHYRPFDFRKIYYTSKSNGCIGRPRYDIMKHFINRENIGLNFKRQIGRDRDFSDALVVNKMVESCLFESANANNVMAPLYLYEDIDSSSDFNFDEECRPNFKAPFLDFLKKYLGGSLIKSEDYPHKILSYIYAVLYAPAYRSRYKEDLKYDYPRIPFTDDGSLFDSLSSLGSDLIDLHLLKKVPAPSSSYPISGDDNIDFCKFEDNKIKINFSQYFDNVSEEAYNYSIGGYKPIEKYIKARETLTLNDIMHIQKVISVIEKTIEIQKSIDEVYKKIDK